MKRFSEIRTKIILVFGLMLFSLPMAFAQGIDTEPNNACMAAQDLGTLSLPFIIDGSLDTPPEEPDVDFFKLTGEPGTRVRVDYEGADTGAGTLSDPFLGLFDSNCELLESNDDADSLNSRLQFVIPASGMFILAATSCCESGFIGEGGSSGTYKISIATPPPSIGSITGRVVNAISRIPLPGDIDPFASVSLNSCDDEGCFNNVSSASTDSNGQFRFDVNFSGIALDEGTYQIQAFANNFDDGQTDQFEIGENEDLDVGDISLNPPPVKFSEIRACGNLPPQGGECLYSVKITNTSPDDDLSGLAWSFADGFGIGSRLDFTKIHAGQQHITISAGSSRIVRFLIDIPDTVQNSAEICTEVYFGENPSPLFNTLGQEHLFCITKGPEAFRIMPDNEAQKIFRRLDRNTRNLKGNKLRKIRKAPLK